MPCNRHVTAELTWLSQYPHEREILFPPLTGIEMVSSDVDGNSLVIQVRSMERL